LVLALLLGIFAVLARIKKMEGKPLPMNVATRFYVEVFCRGVVEENREVFDRLGDKKR